MTAVYLDASAVLAWLLGEPDADRVLDAVGAAEAVLTSQLTIAECGRAIEQARSQGRVTEAAAHTLRALLASEQSKWLVMAITSEVLARTGRGFPIEPVRTLDAVHLATALAFCEVLPGLTFLSLDRRVHRNAEELGLALA